MKIEIFEKNEVRVIDENNQKFIPAIDIARAIGYETPSRVISDMMHNNLERFENYSCVRNIRTQGQGRKTTLLNKNGVVAFCMLSKHKNALKFQRWSDNVLATVLDKGSYQLSPMEQIHNALQLSQNIIKEQQLSIERMEPKEEFYDDIANSKDNLSILQVAKLLKIGRNTLTAKLRELKILFYDADGSNIPYQNQQDNGNFIVVLRKYKRGEKVHLGKTSLITQKGLKYLQKRLKK